MVIMVRSPSLFVSYSFLDVYFSPQMICILYFSFLLFIHSLVLLYFSVDTYKNETAENVRNRQMSGPKMVNTNPLDALDFQSPEFRGKSSLYLISLFVDLFIDTSKSG